MGRADGLALIAPTPEAAWQSFAAALICLPAFLAVRLLAWEGGGTPAAGPVLGLAAELLGYACRWVGFALATLPLAEAANRRAHWPHFIAAWNWAQVVQYTLLAALLLPTGMGLPAGIAHGIGLSVLGYGLWLDWFVTRHALRVPAWQAAAFVLLQVLMGVFIGGAVAKITGG